MRKALTKRSKLKKLEDMPELFKEYSLVHSKRFAHHSAVLNYAYSKTYSLYKIHTENHPEVVVDTIEQDPLNAIVITLTYLHKDQSLHGFYLYV